MKDTEYLDVFKLDSRKFYIGLEGCQGMLKRRKISRIDPKNHTPTLIEAFNMLKGGSWPFTVKQVRLPLVPKVGVSNYNLTEGEYVALLAEVALNRFDRAPTPLILEEEYEEEEEEEYYEQEEQRRQDNLFEDISSVLGEFTEDDIDAYFLARYRHVFTKEDK